ncbi:MAG: protein-disulfide reductase DsbD [Pseudomonadota bacterium]
MLKYRTQIKYLVFLLILLISNTASALTPLNVNKAFQITVIPARVDAVVLKWKIAKNYYLYKERIHIRSLNTAIATLGKIRRPQGIKKYDEILGHYQVYKQRLTLSVPLLLHQKQSFKLAIAYQGCSFAGFCYPPIKKVIEIKSFPITSTQDFSIANPNIGTNTATLNPQQKAESILTYQNVFIALLAFFGFGLLLAFTPCVLPMLPILSAIIVDNTNRIKPWRAFSLSLTYVLAMSCAFAMAGILVGYLGENLQTALQIPWVILSFAVIFIVLALSLFGLFEIRLPKRLHNYLHSKHQQQQGGSYIGVALMGFLAMLVVSPCVTPPLVGALTYIAHTGNSLLGGSALFVMSFGMGVPLLIIGTSLGSLLPKTGMWMEMIKKLFGIAMLAMAIWISQRVLPTSIINTLAGILALFSAWLIKKNSQKMKLIPMVMILLLSIIAFYLFISAMLGKPLYLNSNKTLAMEKRFHIIKSPKELNQQLKIAKKQQKFVLLDFYADWCVSCKQMDRRIFANPQVQTKLSKFYLIRANITANSPQNKALSQQFNVIAPPTIVFFSVNSSELNQYRIVGDVSRRIFIKKIEQILAKN